MVSRQTALEALRGSQLFESAGEEALRELAENSRLAVAERSETIWSKGSDVGFIGLVSQGFVKMVRGSPTGQELTAEIMGPGQAFGLLGSLDGEGCPLSARAACQTEYFQIPKELFLQHYSSNPKLQDILVRRTAMRLKNAYDLMGRMSAGRVQERIAAVLFVLSTSYAKETPEGLLLTVPLTRQDISEMAGTTVESTIRTMSKWQKAGIVRTEHKIVTIVDPEALERCLSS